MGGFNFNPILSEIQSHFSAMSPEAQGAVHMAGITPPAPDPTTTAPGKIAPGMLLPHPDAGAPQGPIGMESQTPPLTMPSQTPQLVTGPKRGQEMMSGGQQVRQGTVLGDTAERGRLLDEGPPVNNIYHNITTSGFGENHPFLGKLLGGVAEVGGKIGDTLANGLPGIGREIPGTTVNHNMLLKQANANLTEDVGNAQKEAQTASENATAGKTNAETPEVLPEAEAKIGLENAQASEAPSAIAEHNAQTANLLHPQAKTEFEAWQAQNPGKPIEDWIKAQAASKNMQPKEQLQQQLIAAEGKGDTAGAAKLKQQLKDLDPNAEQRIVIQQQTAANNQTKASDAKTEKEFAYTRGKWDKDLGTYNTQNEKLAEASQLVGSGSMGAALGSVKALSGLAGGQGSGVRITQAELNSIANARGLGGDFEAALQKFGDGNKLTPEQVHALKGIISDVQKIAGAKEAVINQGLDDLGNATDTKTIRKIDSQLRHVLMGGQ